MPRDSISHAYNPANQTKTQLIEGFVIRNKEFRQISDDILNCSLDESPQHYLIEGQRGTGKTSLLLRTRYAIEDSKERDDLIVIQFPEEQYNIFSLSKLWESIAEDLAEEPEFKNIEEQIDRFYDNVDYSQTSFTIIDKHLEKNNKRLVLLLDNFGDILNRLSELDQQRLRDHLHTSPRIQIIGASSETLEHTYKHDKPFFEFFRKIRLGGLNEEETHTLLKSLGKAQGVEEKITQIIDTEPQRIETLRRLTGGMPRTILFLFQIILDDSAEIFSDLESILDKVTPLYKHRMDDLKPQQQAIVDAIALNWDGITAKEIQNRLRDADIDSKKISAQLRLLEKNDLVTSKKIDKKNKIYFIAERFFNIWYLMRLGRKRNKTHVRWLVEFLKEWCTPEDLKQKAIGHLRMIKERCLNPKGGFYMAHAIAEASSDYKIRKQILEETSHYLKESNEPELSQELENTEKEYSNSWLDEQKILAGNNDIEALVNLGEYYLGEGKPSKSLKYFKEGEKLNDPLSLIGIGLIYHHIDINLDEAITYYKKALKLVDHLAFPKMLLADALYKNGMEKLLCYDMAKYASSNNNGPLTLGTLLLAEAWNDQFNKSNETFSLLFNSKKHQAFNYFITNYLLLLLSKGQLYSSLNLFNKFEDLKEEFKPIYFALLKLLGKDYEKEYLKMGPELETTVEEILEEVENFKIKYS